MRAQVHAKNVTSSASLARSKYSQELTELHICFWEATFNKQASFLSNHYSPQGYSEGGLVFPPPQKVWKRTLSLPSCSNLLVGQCLLCPPRRSASGVGSAPYPTLLFLVLRAQTEVLLTQCFSARTAPHSQDPPQETECISHGHEVSGCGRGGSSFSAKMDVFLYSQGKNICMEGGGLALPSPTALSWQSQCLAGSPSPTPYYPIPPGSLL